MTENGMMRTAVIAGFHSEWRYELWRRWGPRPNSIGRGSLVFVMLNPSTADSKTDDPTVRRCVGFAWGAGYTGLKVVNLFAHRDRDPGFLVETGTAAAGRHRAHVRECRRTGRRPLDRRFFEKNEQESYVGPDNDAWIKGACERKDVVLAWGSRGPDWRAEEVLEILKGSAARILCLGRTKAGRPRHPLYVPASKALEPWFSEGKTPKKI